MANKQDVKTLAAAVTAGIEKDLGAVSAYAIAVEHGYEGTEEEWAAAMQKALNSVDESAASAQAAKESADAAAQSAKDAQSAAGEAAEEAAQAAAELVKPEIESLVTEQIAPVNEAVKELQRSKADAIVETASGESLHVDDASGNGLHNLKVYGKATQVKTNGYQLFDASKLSTKSEGGATVTNNDDGSFTISGSGNLSTEFNLLYSLGHDETIHLLKNGKIKINENSTYPYVGVYLYYENATKYYTLISNVTLSSDITEEMLSIPDCHLKFYFYGSKSRQIKSGTVKPMLYQDGDGTWEPFTGGQASPSPEYPQEIEVSGSEGTIDVTLCGNNLFDPSKTENGKSVNYKNGSIVNSRNYFISEYIPISSFKKLNMSINGSANIGRETWLYDKDKKPISDLSTYNSKNLPENAKYLIVSRVISSKNNIMLNSGESILPFEEYKDGGRITLQTPNGLPGIPVESGGNYTDASGQEWLSDFIDCSLGKRFNKVVVDVIDHVNRVNNFQSSAFSYNVEENHFPVLGWHETQPLINSAGLKNVGFSNIASNNDCISVVTTDNATNWCYAIKISSIEQTLESYNQYLAQHPITVVTIAGTAAQEETALSAEEIAAYKALHTNKLVTNVFSDSDPQVGTQMDYGADTKTYIDKKFDALATAILKIGE